MNWSMIAKHLIKLLPCLSGSSLLPPPLKRSINNYFLMSFAWQKIIHFQPPSLHHKNHLLITILPYTWQNTKILFNLLPFLSSDFHYLLLIFHKSAQALFLTSYNPNKVLITKTAIRHLSVLYRLSSILSPFLIKILVSIYLLPWRTLFPSFTKRPRLACPFLFWKSFYLSGFILLTQKWGDENEYWKSKSYCPIYRAFLS